MCFLLFLTTNSAIDASKVLLLLPFPGPSHFMMFKVFIEELVGRGHEVTSINAFPLKENLENYTEILIEPRWSFSDGCEYFPLECHEK